MKAIIQFPKLNKKIHFIIMMTLIFTMLLAFNSAYALNEWVNEDSKWDVQGCRLNVHDETTDKWSAGIYHRYWENHVDWVDQVNMGDSLWIDAYTCYTGSKLWIYEDGVLVDEIGSGSAEHIYYRMTANAENIRIACSAAPGARNGEQLSVNIKTTGDKEPPVVTVTNTNKKVIKGQNLTATMTDNKGVVGYYISRSTTTPSASRSGWTTFSSTTPYYLSLAQNGELGNYYIWAKDEKGNVSDRDSFEVGLAPSVSVDYPQNVEILEGSTAMFQVFTTDGSTPFSYQWYKCSSASDAGSPISGATGVTLTLNNVPRSDNDKYYYCKVTNRFSSVNTRHARLIVLYPPTLKNLPGTEANPILIKKGGSYTINSEIDTHGNTTYYTYQWYRSGTPTGTTRIIDGATSSSYTVTPTEDFVAYYMTEIKNYWNDHRTVAYTRTTPNRGKVIADVTEPEIAMGDITITPTPNVRHDQRYINNTFTISIPFTVTDKSTGYTYVENGSNLTADEIQILVGGTNQTCTKNITYRKVDDYKVEYVFTATNIPSNGPMTVRIPANIFYDKIGNGNLAKDFSTNIMVDNTLPVVAQESYIGGVNEKYMNREKTLTVRLVVTDNYGFDSSEFTVDDIVVKVNGNNVNSDVITSLTPISGNDTRYIYELTMTNVQSPNGDGPLSVLVDTAKIRDWATNGNASTNVPLKVANGEQIIVDNTPPQFSITAELNGNYGSGVIYPTDLEDWHDNWAKESIYITIPATDNYKIDYYTTSTKSGAEMVKMTEGTLHNQEVLVNEYNGYRYYRVYDMAGNFTEHDIEIKIDKTAPKDTMIDYYELRVNGVKYNYSQNKQVVIDAPANRNIILRPIKWEDQGDVQSGIRNEIITEHGKHAQATSKANASRNNRTYVTYYKITMYTTPSMTEVVSGFPKVYPVNTSTDGDENAVSDLFEEDGFFKVEKITTDIAGNVTISPLEYFYISKSTNNTIRISKIADVGSGVKRAIINVYKADSIGNRTDTKAIQELIVEKPSSYYETTVRLGRGTYYVEVVLEDNTVDEHGNSKPNTYKMTQKITNRF